MNRKILSLVIASTLILSVFTACNNSEGEPEITSAESETTTAIEETSAITTTLAVTTTAETTVSETTAPDTAATTTNPPPVTTIPETTPAATTTEASPATTTEQAPTEEITVDKIADAIKAAYGGSYLPNMPVEKEMASQIFGLEEGSFTEFFAETPMISMHVDTLVIVKAANGKANDVKSALEAYRTNLIENTLQYPMNMPKLEASQVVQNGDYIAYILLGGYNDDNGATEEDNLKFFEDQVKIGVDTFNKCFS